MKHSVSVDVDNKKIVYKTKNIFSDDGRYLHFICDQPHAVKTARNNLAHSDFDKIFSFIVE